MKDNFFDRAEIKAIETIQNGYEYICIIQKMYLRSLCRNGKLMVTDMVPYDLQTLSGVLGHKQETIRAAIEVFRKFGLCEILEDHTIYMTEIQNFIGESSTEADRIRAFRKQIDEDRTNVRLLTDISTPKIELKTEKEIKTKLDE
jgi:predicted phage replisome organizer